MWIHCPVNIYFTASRCWSVNLRQRCVPPCYLGAWHTKCNTFLHPFKCKTVSLVQPPHATKQSCDCFGMRFWLGFDQRVSAESYCVSWCELIKKTHYKSPGLRGVDGVASWLQGVIHCRCPIAVQAQQACVDLVLLCDLSRRYTFMVETSQCPNR